MYNGLPWWERDDVLNSMTVLIFGLIAILAAWAAFM
jgi:hypothetical protein